MDLDLLDQDRDYTTAQQLISTALPLIPAASMQHNSMPTPGLLPDHAQDLPDHAQDLLDHA